MSLTLSRADLSVSSDEALHPIGLELILESGKSYIARCVDVSWRFRMTERRAKHVGRKAMKA